MSRQPEGPPPPPVVQRLRIRYSKRGPLRFTSHRDVARAFERAIRRAGLPIAYSAGFTPHPKVSWVGAAPTGAASEAEYVEIGLAEPREPDQVRVALDAALPDGIGVVEVVDAAASGSRTLAERITASRWRIVLPQVAEPDLAAAVDRLMEQASVPVERAVKDGRRAVVDVRAALLRAEVGSGIGLAPAPPDARLDNGPSGGRYATLDVVVQHSTPAVRPDDILTALRSAAGLSTPVTALVTRLAQGLVDETSREGADRLLDPLAELGG
jgi:radical SAM-linked protein